MIPFALALALALVSHVECNDARSICAAFTPFDDVTALVASTISAAKKSVTVATFNISDDTIADALIERAKAGVDVTVLIDFSRPNNAAIDRLRSAPGLHFIRVPSLRGGGPQMHAKLVVIDDDTVIAGTGNFTEAALVSSVESWLILHDPTISAEARRELDAIVARTKTACTVFAPRSPKCPEGDVDWDPALSTYAKTGRFRPKDVIPGAHCASFAAGKERLDAWPIDRNRSDVDTCLRDPRFGELVRRLAAPKPMGVVDKALGLLVAQKPVDTGRAHVAMISAHDVDIEELFLAAIAHAHNVTASLSHLTDKSLIEALAGARARGAAVDVVVGAFSHDDAAGTASGEDVVDRLPFATVVRDGFLAHASLFHDKSVLVDERLLFSSANWSMQAFTRSDEDFFVVDDPAIVAAFQANAARVRALVGAPSANAGGNAGANPGSNAAGSIVIVRAQTTTPKRLELRVGGKTIPMRWDGSRPVTLLGAVDVEAPIDAEIEGVRVRLVPHGAVSVIDVALPASTPSP